MTELWNTIILNPMLNGLVAVSGLPFGNFGLAIIALTILIRLITFPLSWQQLKSTKAMQALQPKLQEVQKKYARDRARLQQEMMKMYKEAGVNPIGCLFPMLVQFPIWIALYQSIVQALAATPEDLISLSQHLYSWSIVNSVIPVRESFVWLNLGQPDFLLAILVAASMWVQQKMVTAPATDPSQQSMNNMTLTMMPMMFGLFAMQFPSGLALYWVVSNLIGIITQYFMTGWGYLLSPNTARIAIADKKLPGKS